ncbi:MAG: hypothetical protein AAGU11_05150 [Syntrophobacteraceae bacterium]
MDDKGVRGVRVVKDEGVVSETLKDMKNARAINVFFHHEEHEGYKELEDFAECL